MDDIGVVSDDRLAEEPGTVSPARSARGIGDLLRAVVYDVQDLVRAEVSLARGEIDQKVERMVMALVWTFGGMMLGFAALVIIMMAGVDALRPLMPVWAGSLLVGFVVALVGALIAWSGVRSLSVDRLAPKRTVRNLQADAQMVREHT
jgi:Putative Actinobacterial Holin-X, holin superfamily III